MRVLFVLNSLGGGGTERSTAVLLPALRDRGFECRVAIFTSAREGDEAAVREAGFPVDVVGNGTTLSRVKALRKLIKSWRPDVVHTAIFESDLAGRLATFRLGAPVLTSLVNTSYDPVRLDDPNIRPWRLRVVRSVDGFTGRHLTERFHAVSDGVAQANAAALGLDPRRITVVERGREHPSIDRSAARRAAVRSSLGVDDDTFVVLALGRHEYQKAHEVLVDAAVELAKTVPHCLVLIAGREGSATAMLTERIRTSSAEQHVRLLGYRSDVYDLLAAADAFAMPSRYEGTAGSILEAFAAGLPVVATDVVGLRGILDDRRNSLVVPVGDARALARALAELAGQPSLRESLARSGQDDFAKRFELSASADRMAELYRAVAKRENVPV